MRIYDIVSAVAADWLPDFTLDRVLWKDNTRRYETRYRFSSSSLLTLIQERKEASKSVHELRSQRYSLTRRGLDIQIERKHKEPRDGDTIQQHSQKHLILQ